MNESTAPQTQSPFATPAAAPATPPTAPPVAPAASPFAAPAQTAAPITPPTEDMGDTGFLDSVDPREPLIKQCVVPGVVVQLEPKENEEGKQRISIAVQLYGDKMVFDDGTPVSPGKRLSTTVFLPIDTPEKKQRTERKLQNLILGLNNIPLDGHAKAAYAALPPVMKVGLLMPGPKHPELAQPKLSLHPFKGNNWVGTKVLVQVTVGRDMDNNLRNEFNILAASTKPVERKARS